MFILNISFSKSPEVVSKYVGTHGDWVKKYIDAGIFLCAGPKPSKLGGVIIAKSMDKSKLLAIIAEDSYVLEDVADYQITEFDCKLTSGDFNILTGV